MLRDLAIFRRNSGKMPPARGDQENIPVDPSLDSASAQLDPDPSRAPLHAIQEPIPNPKPGKIERTPSKNQQRTSVFEGHPPFRTPEKLATARNRFGWVPKGESRSNGSENGDEVGQLPALSRGIGSGHGIGSTPRSYRTAGKASSVQSDCSSTQSTPTKSVTKPAYSGSSRPPLSSGPRTMNFSAAPKGIPMSCAPPVFPNSVEVPHFELKEDPSFWMEHNVQVVIRVRPLNRIERSLQGYNRCLKQESTQSIVWVGQPDARFTFDHVACETVGQEMLFRVAGLPMVENCMSGYNSCIFAYGQTGSGKTYTMLGEIDEFEIQPSPRRGMTPRIFEFLFARIKAEEESRRDEKLRYNCKCSFLEIYNEQIADLLDPTSTNLLLREDLRKGVYVENLTEFEVESVNDILKVLTQGAANRKVAATNMNRESSRSHSVFTCVIESRWEKDSTTNLRFARLNLVDLAGSERQKTSGAEGERLKEAANINKSLSTLGHVIMILADMAHGKQRHVPYRDSRLTFLLQDSLGGNSKTMIIANVSPSICCANETLSTLKFAQRARLIQNNAVVNEDASGDVVALKHQIRLLKEELLVFKRQRVSRSLSFHSEIVGDSEGNAFEASAGRMHEIVETNADGFTDSYALNSIRVSTKQLRSLEATLAGALRREKKADTAIKQLEAEIKQLNQLVHQREEDTRSSKMMLKFREDKIHKMESLASGLLPADSYLAEDNRVLLEEIQLLQAKVDKNPEVTRFALENIRLLDQLHRFQEFYEEGEREILLNEVSELRNQLLQVLDGKYGDQILNSELGIHEATHHQSAKSNGENYTLRMQLETTCNELEVCKNDLKCCIDINSKLTREINDLQTELGCLKHEIHQQNISLVPHDEDMCNSSEIESKIQPSNAEYTLEVMMKHTEEILNLQLELDILKEILKEEKSYCYMAEGRAAHANNELTVANEKFAEICKLHDDLDKELKDARSVIEALEARYVASVNEVEKLREENYQYVDLLKKQEQELCSLRRMILFPSEGEGKPLFTVEEYSKKSETEDSLQAKLKWMQASLDKARMLNVNYQTDQASQTLHEQEMEVVRSQVEAETAEVIVCLQEELMALQQQVDGNNRDKLLVEESLVAVEKEIKQLNEQLSLATHDNERLTELLEEKDGELQSLMEDWERLAYDIAVVLADGNAALQEVFEQASSITDTLPHRSWVGEQVGKMVRCIHEKDELIYELQSCLEDAQNVQCEMECKLRSLRGATLAITEAQQQETGDNEQDILLLTSQLSEKDSCISELESRIRLDEEKIRRAEVCATVAFMSVKRLCEKNNAYHMELEQVKLMLNQSDEIFSQKNAILQGLMLSHADAENQVRALKRQLDQYQDDAMKSELGYQEQKQTRLLENQMRNEEDVALSRISNDLKKTRQKLNEFKAVANSLPSLTNGEVEAFSSDTRVDYPKNVTVRSEDNDTKDRMEIESINIDDNDQHIQNVPGSGAKISPIKDSSVCKCEGLAENIYEREATIILLRKEIESALDSLEEVQAQMIQLCYEKEENKKNEMQKRESTEQLVAQVLKLESDISNKEQQHELRLLELEKKLQILAGNAIESHECWLKAKKVLELEVTGAEAMAAQKTVEASDLLSKVEECQQTMRDAESMIKALLEMKSCLENKVQVLQSSLDTKEKEYEYIETKFHTSIAEQRSLVLVLEDTLSLLQTTMLENFKFISHDFGQLKSQLHNSLELARTWFEDIWSEIIGKDCAVSVLHLCHIGILLERLTGLNAENGFLSRGLCGSNSIIADLRENNARAKKELEMCSILKGKLLVDINNSFNRIAKKEDETVEFRAKLNNFEKKIMNLQFQEESMLARTNSMGTELAMLMKEFDMNSKNASDALLLQEKLLREKEDLYKDLDEKSRLLNEIKGSHEMLTDLFYEDIDPPINDSYPVSEMLMYDLKAVSSQTESLMVNFVGKQFELLVLWSELEQKIMKCNQMTSQIDCLEGYKLLSGAAIEKIKEEMILQEIEREQKIGEIEILLLENKRMKSYVDQLEEENSRINENLEKAKAELVSSSTKVLVVEQDNQSLEETICSLSNCLSNLQADIDIKDRELDHLKFSHNTILKELDLNMQTTEIQMERTDALISENNSLKSEITALKKKDDEAIAMLIRKLKHLSDSMHSMIMHVERMLHQTYDDIVLSTESMYQKLCEQTEVASMFTDKVNFLEMIANEMTCESLSLHKEVLEKDEASKVLLYDLSLLQESAYIAKGQKDELEELTGKLELLEDELVRKTSELKEVIADKCMFEAHLHENTERISALELELAENCHSLSLALGENRKLKINMDHIIEMKAMIEEELRDKTIVAEKLEMELLEMTTLLGQRNNCIDNLQSELIKLAKERDHLDSVVLDLKEQLEVAQALAEENEAIATEARQLAEVSKTYAEGKEQEVRILEKSVEELECTVNALENKVEIVKGEAERQRLQREEIEMELQLVRHHMLTVPATAHISNITEDQDAELSRKLEEKATELQAAQRNIRNFQKELADKDAEIVQCQNHISELNMHAEAQARESKQKFKELEAMAQLVRTESMSSNATSMTSSKSEKSVIKSRGSGSPFKCIGLGLAQQINSEKEEELIAAKHQIEELEALVASKQKDIFMLNTRLAAAESMTHDVIRDLLGVKLDMANYAILLDNQHVMKDPVQLDAQECQHKDQEAVNLRKQLNEFIQERQSWLDEINQKQTELTNLQITLEKRQQWEHALSTENEMLKANDSRHKQMIIDLENELDKVSKQQNLQHRIHHHAKIKEENKLLKVQNEDLNGRLQQLEAVHSRVREELAHYRAADGKNLSIDFDTEEKLKRKLEESEKERLQLGQQLLRLCASILKVAGCTQLASNTSPSAAEDAVGQIKSRINSLEIELEDLKLKCKLYCEKIRLAELEQESLPICTRSCET